MCSMNTIYHVYSHGKVVLFRNNQDYVTINNNIAVLCYKRCVKVLAFSYMSTHIHLLVESPGDEIIQSLVSDIFRIYSIEYSIKYGKRLRNQFSLCWKTVDEQSFMNELLYVMKNPVHHTVARSVFSYQYTSASWIFLKELIPDVVIIPFLSGCSAVSEISVRRLRGISRSVSIPGEWLVSNYGMILPLSYVAVESVRAIWNNNVKKFLYDINKNSYDADYQILSADTLDIRCLGMNDIQVCTLIDKYVADKNLRSFHFLEQDGASLLARKLSDKLIPESQIRRCLWME
mgnify:CR=1 FL=1